MQQEKVAQFTKKCLTCSGTFPGHLTNCPADGTPLTAIVPDKEPGDIIADKYQVIEVVGTGGMGKVYKAKHLLMNRIVAIKTLLPQAVSNAIAMKRFQQEAQACSALNHPNLLTVYDFGITPDGLPYLVMDFLEGMSLADAMPDNGHFSVRRALPIFLQIARGLAHAHEQGVIHRDLKPANIMLVDYNGVSDFVKIVDFGIAKVTKSEDDQDCEHLTHTGEIFGSPLYMSPEQCRGKTLDARSDIYSFGCVMFRTLTGRPPYLGGDRLEAMFNQINQQIPSLNEVAPEVMVTPELEAIATKCLSKEPDERFQTMVELGQALEKLPEFEYKIGLRASGKIRLFQSAKNFLPSQSESLISPTPEVPPPPVASLPVPKATEPMLSSADEAHPINPTPSPTSGQSDWLKELRNIPHGNWITIAFAVCGCAAVITLASFIIAGSNHKDNIAAPASVPTPAPQESPSGTLKVSDTKTNTTDLAAQSQELFSKGRFKEAEAKAQEGLALANKKKDMEGVFANTGQLGKIYLHQFKYDEARSCYTQLFEAHQKDLGISDLHYAQGLNGLGTIAILQNDLPRAQSYLDAAYQIRQSLQGKDRVYLARTIQEQGNLARVQHRYGDAIALLSKAKDTCISAVGMNDSETYSIMSDLGQAYQFARKLPAAEECYKTSLAGRQRTLDPDSPAIAESLMCLASLKRQQNKIDEAIKLYDQALAIDEKAFGTNSLVVAEICDAIGNLYLKAKQLVKAEAYFHRCLSIREALLLPDDPKLRAIRAKDAQLQKRLK